MTNRNYPFKTQPRRHQVKALKKAIKSKSNYFAFFMPMRSGKTKVVIDYAGYRNLRGEVNRVLVICPKSVIGVWKREIAKHLPDECDITWVIVNYERLSKRVNTGKRTFILEPNQKLFRFDADMVVVDESHKIGKPSSLQSSITWNLGKQSQWRVIMTGTPWHRKPLLIFGQYRFLDEGVFGTRWVHFKKKHALWGGYGNNVLIKYRRLKQIRAKTKPTSFVLKHLPSRPAARVIVPVPLEESRKVYDDMARDAFVQLSEGVADAPIILTKALRLAQITGGHVRNTEGKTITVGEEKRRTFAELMEQFSESEVQKIVCFARFRPDLKVMAEVVQDYDYMPLLLHGGVSTPKREQRIDHFQESDEPCVFISQVSAGALGIELSAAQDIVWYGLTENLVDFDQAEARTKMFKDKRAHTHYYLLAEDSVDEAMYMALKAKMELVELMMKHPDLIQKG